MALLTNINGKFSVSDAGAVTFNNAFTFPTTDGTANYVLKTNGSGQLAWAADNYENYDYWTLQGDSAANVNINSTNTLKFIGGTYIDTSATWAGGSNPRKLTINHETTSRTDTTSTDAPAFGGTFEAVTSVTTNTTGHVTAIDVSTITIPTDPGGTVKGTGTATRVAFWSASDTITSDADLYWDNTNKRLGIGTTSPSATLNIKSLNSSNSDSLSDVITNSEFKLQYRADDLSSMYLGGLGSERGYLQSINNAENAGTSFSLNPYGGNVGIGTTSPATKLNIRSDASDDGILLEKSDGTDVARLFYDGTSTNARLDMFSGGSATIQLKANGITHFSGGNVGIGTPGPSVKLDVVGSGKFQPGIADGDALVTIAQTNSNAYVHAGIKINAGNTNPFYIYQSGSSNTLRFNYNSLADAGGQLVITDSGNVGIGTTSPDNKLQVVAGNGNVQAWFGENSYTRAALRVGGNNSPGGRLFFEYNGDDSYIDSYGGHGSTQRYRDLTIAARNIILTTGNTSGSEKMRITSDGDLTVNDTNSNNCTLHINSYQKNAGNAARIGNMQICMEGNGSAYPNIGYGQRSTTNTTGYVYAQSDYASWFRFHAGGIQSYTAPSGTSGNAISFTTGPYVSQGGTTWTSGSDINLKENIKPLNKVLDKIKDYRCVEYSLKSDANKSKKIGFIAQDWEQDFAQVIEKDNEENLGIKYTETIPILLKAIQELKADNDSLKARIETLENK